MTTTRTALPTAHAACDHEVSKAARARCRKMRGAAYAASQIARSTAKPKPRLIVEACCCGGTHREGWTMNALGVWVCVTCDRPSAGTITNVLLADVA